jgi:hypothetical protein
VTAGGKESDGSSGKVAICEVATVACQTVDNLGADCPTVDSQTVGQSDSRQSDSRTVDSWTVGQLDSQTVGQSTVDSRTVCAWIVDCLTVNCRLSDG